MISWLFSPDFLILVTVTLIGFLVFLFFRFSSTKRLRKDDPDFLLRDISKSLSSNDSVEMISGNKTTFISLEKNETNKLIEKSVSPRPIFERENFKQLINSKIYNFLSFPFSKKRKPISKIEDEIEEKIDLEEKESINSEKTLEDLSQIELPFFLEESKNLPKNDDSPIHDRIIDNEVDSKKDIQLNKRDEISFFRKSEVDKT